MNSSSEPSRDSASLRGDFFASMLGFLLAVPVCLAIALASGLPPEAGLVTGIVGGMLVGFFSGSTLQVSGPAAGLIVVVLNLVSSTQGEPAKYAAIVVLAGMLQVLSGVAGLSHCFRAISPSVLLGMLSGMGVTIVVRQFHAIFDQSPPLKNLDAVLLIPETLITLFLSSGSSSSVSVALVSILTLMVLFGWPRIAPRPLSLIPSAVMAVLIATIVSCVLSLPLKRLAVGGLWNWFSPENTSRFAISALPEMFLNPWVWQAGLVLALISSGETILSATTIDRMHSGPRTRFNRELLAQGMGNIVCGVLGVLPLAGSCVRSQVNVEAGAKSRLASVGQGLCLLLFLTAGIDVMEQIPVVALAIVMVVWAWKLLNLPAAIRYWKSHKGDGWVFLVTFLLVLILDFVSGVLVGLLVAALRFFLLYAKFEIKRMDELPSSRIHLHFLGSATFLRLQLIAHELNQIPAGKELHIRLDKVRLIDQAVLEHLLQFREQYETRGGEVMLSLKGSESDLPLKREPVNFLAP